ncbi:unnamed protein product [Brassica oleracea var. botrytis]
MVAEPYFFRFDLRLLSFEVLGGWRRPCVQTKSSHLV